MKSDTLRQIRRSLAKGLPLELLLAAAVSGGAGCQKEGSDSLPTVGLILEQPAEQAPVKAGEIPAVRGDFYEPPAPDGNAGTAPALPKEAPDGNNPDASGVQP